MGFEEAEVFKFCFEKRRGLVGDVALEWLGARPFHGAGVGGLGGPLRGAARSGEQTRVGRERGGGGRLPWPGTPRPIGALICRV